MKYGKHSRLTLNTMIVCGLALSTAGKHRHMLAINFLQYSKNFPHGAGTHYQVSTVTQHT